MMRFSQAMADALTAVSDWPRLWLYLAHHGKLDKRPGFWKNMTLNHLMQCWGAEYVRAGSADARTWLLASMREQRTREMFGGEQLSSVYTTYYLAAAVAVRVAAVQRADREMIEEVDRYIAAWLALVELVACPGDWHRDVAHRIFAPGCRSGDPFGGDPRTDVCRLALLGVTIPSHWRLPSDSWTPEQRHPWMEAELVLAAARSGGFAYIPAPDAPPIRSTMVVERYERGFRAWVENLERCAGFPVWSVVVRRDGMKNSVSYRDTGRKNAKLGGGGPAPAGAANMPGLASLVSRVVVGPAGAARPEPPSPTPEPPPRPPGGEAGSGGWEHRKLAIDDGEIILRVRPAGAEVEFLRRHRQRPSAGEGS